MKKQIRSIFAVTLLTLAFTIDGLRAEGLSILVVVKGPDGKPVPGAQVQIERKDAKAPVQVAPTDAKGRIYFQMLALGTYRVSALHNRVPVSEAIVKTRTDVPMGVSLNVKSVAKTVSADLKHKRYVYISEETGTHIGGGRWIEVNDDGTIPDNSGSSVSPLDKRSGRIIDGTSSFQPHPGGVVGN